MKLTLTLFFSMLLLDYIYFSIMGKELMSIFSKIQKDDVTINYKSMALCYILMAVSLAYFIKNKRISPFDAFILGILVYGVFELTNYTVFKNWPISVVIYDTLWGGFLFYTCVHIIKSLNIHS
jgi:uncharacterized membrane protein